jgi:hypothetical protein
MTEAKLAVIERHAREAIEHSSGHDPGDVLTLAAEVRRLQKTAAAADRFCDCLNEFGAEGLRFCSEHLEELEKALEASAAREAGRGESE